MLDPPVRLAPGFVLHLAEGEFFVLDSAATGQSPSSPTGR